MLRDLKSTDYFNFTAKYKPVLIGADGKMRSIVDGNVIKSSTLFEVGKVTESKDSSIIVNNTLADAKLLLAALAEEVGGGAAAVIKVYAIGDSLCRDGNQFKAVKTIDVAYREIIDITEEITSYAWTTEEGQLVVHLNHVTGDGEEHIATLGINGFRLTKYGEDNGYAITAGKRSSHDQYNFIKVTKV